MGKKSRLKKLKRRGQYPEEGRERTDQKTREPFLARLIFIVSGLVLFVPLLFNKNFYFPFVGPKGLVFLAISEIIFFLWLFLAFFNKRYRPSRNSILVALAVFLVVLILSSVFGVDFSRSFWSKYERMTGLLIWLHLFAFFLVISSVFQRVSEWKKFFIVSIGVGLIISILALLEYAGLKDFAFSDRGGATFGNTSFLGTYLLFNVFLGFWLASQTKNRFWQGIFSFGIVLMLLTIYLSQAKAAFISSLGGFGLIAFLWFSFKVKNKRVRILSRLSLGISLLVFALFLVLLFLPHNFVHQEFVKLTGQARVENWQIAWKSFLERPWLGWGPENYTIAFPKFFNPCFFVSQKCGGEIWFDRSHNIVFDTLATTGLIGFLAYLGLFLAAFWVFAKRYFRKKDIDFWTFAVFPSALMAYFVQNLTVFDMTTSLLYFVIFLGFGVFLARRGNKPAAPSAFPKLKTKVFAALVLFLIFGLAFFRFVVGPFKTDYYTIEFLKASRPEQKIKIGDKTLKASPMGRYQIRNFFAEATYSRLKQNIGQKREDPIVKEAMKRELDFVIENLKKNLEESPLDYRSALRISQTYNLYSLLDKSKLVLAEKYGDLAMKLSPTNQQSYWTLAQTKAMERDFDKAIKLSEEAIDLEPDFPLSYQMAVRMAAVAGDSEKAKKLANDALARNFNWNDFPGYKEFFEQFLKKN